MQDELELVDPDPIALTFPCIRASQPIGDMFIASMPFKTLIMISYFDVRRVLQEQRDVEKYLGIQRPIDNSRVRNLGEYVNYKDASFPTSVILALGEEYAKFDAHTNTMTVSNCKAGEARPSIPIRRLAKVLDGQHRIAGLKEFQGATFDMSVTLFIGADIADQAQVFATVNLEQTKVQKSLVYDLFALAKTRSPQKTCHNIAVALDRDSESAFYHRIKRLGFATEGRIFEPITQATFVESLLPYITEDAKHDRDVLLRGDTPKKVGGDDAFKLIFRNMFIAQEDLKIAEVVSNYFEAIRGRWPEAWEERGRGMILNRTNGFRALMRFLRFAYLQVGVPGDVPSTKKFATMVFSKVDVHDREFTIENFPPGTSGEAKLVRVLRGKDTLR